MRIEVDQSGKVEDIGRRTVVASADINNNTKSVLISARTKRKIQELFRTTGRSRVYVYKIFSILLFYLTKNVKKSDLIVVDLEYPGKNKIILDMLIDIRQKYKLPNLNVRFARIGNKPKAHYAAKNVFNDNKKADVVVGMKEMMTTIKKTDGRLRGCISTLVGARPRSSCAYYNKKKRK
jgi:hypothetical protein